jgi:hypothetical protein
MAPMCHYRRVADVGANNRHNNTCQRWSRVTGKAYDDQAGWRRIPIPPTTLTMVTCSDGPPESATWAKANFPRISKNLVGAAGIEPATLGLEIRCSIRLSYAPVADGSAESKLYAIQRIAPRRPLKL